MLDESQARKLVEEYIGREGPITPTQEILDFGAVPRLKGYCVRPGKVSDSIFGGKGSYVDKATGKQVEFENPPLLTKDGVPLRFMVRTQRISTHDINRGEIPFKDQILALNHQFMRALVREALGTSQFDVPGLSPNAVVIAAENLMQIPIENVLRAYMAKSTTATSLYQAWLKGDKEFAGHPIPRDLMANGPLPYLMDTPSTKSDEHDETVSPAYLFERDICTQQDYRQMINAGIFAFGIVSNFLRERGLILVDTKFEHGRNQRGEIVSQDELFTMDSSRFWLLKDYQEQLEKLRKGEIEELDPRSYSKEFARGFSKGEEEYTSEQKVEIAVRYLIGLQHLIGEFELDQRPRDERVKKGLETIVEQLAA